MSIPTVDEYNAGPDDFPDVSAEELADALEEAPAELGEEDNDGR